jgi:hypothetical protein
MNELSVALREAGHTDIAAALERKELAGRLRQSGRDDLADALEANSEPTPATEEPKAEPPTPHEQLAKRLHEAQSPWFSFGRVADDDHDAA